MTSFVIFGLIVLVSIVLGLVKFGTIETESWNWQRKFAEAWNSFVNFFIAGMIGYYLMTVRWPLLLRSETLYVSDFILFAILAMGLFGHLNVLSYNLTKGVEAILERVLKK